MSGRSLRDVCRDDDMPVSSTVYKWIAANPDFSRQYARATEVRADVLADEMFDIADTPVMGVKTKVDGEGNVETTEGDMIEHRRLQIDTRKWALARMNPRKYGDKIQLGGAADLPPVQTLDATRLSSAALAELMAARDASTEADGTE